MKKSEVRVGGVYLAKVSGKLTKVRVDSTHYTNQRGDRGTLVYHVTNLTTNRKTQFRSAAKFRQEVTE